MVVVVGNGERMLKVDAHTHILPSRIPDEFAEVPLRLIHYEGPRFTGSSGPFMAKLEYKETGKLFRELKANCFDPVRILEECDECGVDVQVLCTVPVMFNYQLAPAAGVPWSKFLNDDIAATCARFPNRLLALGTLPLQDTEASIAEVQRALSLGIRGFQVGSHVNAHRVDEQGQEIVVNLPLNHPDLRPVWRECERLGAAIMVHPWDMHWTITEYWQPWLVGMPSETALAGTALILGGVLEEFPKLRVMLSHGGGSLPYIIGRIEWGYKCRPDLVAPDCPKNPREYLKQLYVDSITHDEKVLHYLVDLMSPERVMLGSDYPFPLGEVKSKAPVTGEELTAFPGELIQTSSLTSQQKEALLADTCLEWLGLDAAPFRKHFGIERNAQKTSSSFPPSPPSQLSRTTTADSSASDLELLHVAEKLHVAVVDAFTADAYSGNPAAVVLIPEDSPLSDEQMRKIARQMNLSETAFISLHNCQAQEAPRHGSSLDAFKSRSRFGLRWLTPDGTEVALCGHGTLAAATMLAKVVGNNSDVLVFDTQSGEISTTRDSGPDGGQSTQHFRLDLPANPPQPVEGLSAEVLSVATKLKQTVIKASQMQLFDMSDEAAIELLYSASTKKLLMVLPNKRSTRMFLRERMASDLPTKLLASHDGSIVKGVIVTVRGTEPISWGAGLSDASTEPSGDQEQESFHFESRYFAPWVGIPEDPVTGSAHSVLAPYWADRLKLPASPDCTMKALQCSYRGGQMHLRLHGSARVLILAASTVVMNGQLAWPST